MEITSRLNFINNNNINDDNKILQLEKYKHVSKKQKYFTVDNSDNFYNAIRPILVFSQYMGILLICDVKIKNFNTIIYKNTIMQKFIRIVIVIILFGLLIKFTFGIFKSFAMNNYQFNNTKDILVITSSSVLLVSVFIEYVIFCLLPWKWFKLQRKWVLMEKQLNRLNYDYPRLRWKFNKLAIVMTISTIFVNIYWTYSNFKKNIEAKSHNKLPEGDYNDITNFLFHKFLKIFKFFGSIFHAYVSSFSDLFIILISIGLTDRYKFLNKEAMNGIWNNYEDYWCQLRINYSILSNLVKQTDEIISPLIIISFAYNFMTILLQLCIGISINNDMTFSSAFPLILFGFIIIKTIATLFCISKIHDESKIILPIIYKCPIDKFTIDTKRLGLQLMNDDVALTGMNFFSIKRSFILAVVGAVFTYEIMIIKFSNV